MPDSSFIIRISTPADLTGTTATVQALTAVAAAEGKVAEQGTAAAGATAGVATSAAAILPGNLGEIVRLLTTLVGQGRAAGASLDGVENRLTAINSRLQALASGPPPLKPLADSADHAKGKLSELEHEADHLISALKAGVGIDLGHRLVESIAEVPRIFREAISEGVRFNASMESLTVSLGSAFRAAEPGQFLNFAAARKAGEDALDKLKLKANELGIDFHALGETLSINLATLAEAGIKDVEKQINTVVLLNQVAASKGLSGVQSLRDIIDLLNGAGERTIFGKELVPLGVSNESIKAAKEAGTLYELLTTKLGAYTEAGKASADTFAAAQQRLKNETEQLLGAFTQPIFQELKTAYQELAEEINKPEVRAALTALGFQVAEIVKVGAGLAEFAVHYAGVCVPLAAAVGTVTFALAAFKLAQLAAILPGRLLALTAETAAHVEQTGAVVAETGAIVANTAAKIENTAASKTLSLLNAEGKAVQVANPALSAAEGAGGSSVLGALAAPLAIGVALGVAANVAINAYTASIEAATIRSLELGDSLQKQVATLTEEIGHADTLAKRTKARADLEDGIAIIKAQIGHLSGQDRDVAESQVHLLESMLRHFDEIAGKRQAHVSTEKAIADEQKRQLEYAEELKKVNAEVAGALEKSRFSSLAPREQYGDVKSRLGAEQANFRTAYAGFGGNADSLSPDATADELKEKISGFGSVEGQLNLTQRLQNIIELKGQLDGLLGQIKKVFETHETKREDTEAETEILNAQIAGNDALVDKLREEFAIKKAIRALGPDASAEDKVAANAKVAAEIALTRKKQADDAKKEADEQSKRDADYLKTRNEALLANKEDLDILRAKAAGEFDLADKLEKQRALREEIGNLREFNLRLALCRTSHLGPDRLSNAGQIMPSAHPRFLCVSASPLA